ncbi:hypothetical protein Tco_0402489, partial [Tanacetum coccineum]
MQRVNKQNQFVPSTVLTRTGKIPVNTAKASSTNNFSTARQSFNRQTVLTSTAMKVNTRDEHIDPNPGTKPEPYRFSTETVPNPDIR